jgi:ATP-dependent DNA helicase PIF1
MWRIYGFDLSKNYPSVQQLQLHLPNMHMVSFNNRQKIQHVVNKPGADESMLTAYFKANRLHEFARNILYHDFLEFFTWRSNGKFWRPRERANTGQVGRIVAAHLAEGECYYLRILLNHVAGATLYEDLKTLMA